MCWANDIFWVRTTQTSFVYIPVWIPLTLFCQHQHSHVSSIVSCTFGRWTTIICYCPVRTFFETLIFVLTSLKFRRQYYKYCPLNIFSLLSFSHTFETDNFQCILGTSNILRKLIRIFQMLMLRRFLGTKNRLWGRQFVRRTKFEIFYYCLCNKPFCLLLWMLLQCILYHFLLHSRTFWMSTEIIF